MSPRLLQKRSLSLSGHATSVALEPEFWAVLEAMAVGRGQTLAALVGGLDAARGARPLASACRLAALAHGQARHEATGDAAGDAAPRP